ncbi:MAG TPA: nucleoside-triphosphatase [Phycisphaerae bacterium]|nr:nucleoside-triphosphatase [Phycisphaerae bacterium]
MSVEILSAGRGEGKTTFLCQYLDRLVERGRSVGGIVSLAVFEDGQRIGYDLLDLRSGRRRALARIAKAPVSPPTVGVYQFIEAAINEGNTAVIAAVRDDLDVVAIDEVGPLEFRGQGWAPALETALQECRAEQELIIVVRPALVAELPKRFPSPLWAGARRTSPPWPAPQD